MARVSKVRLTGRASRYVALLQEFGHLDSRAATDFLVAVSELSVSEREQRVDLPEVRRLAASWLFGAEGDPESHPHLAEDWPILFS